VRIIGLTGGIASGKSTISSMFMEAGIPVIDADIIARYVVGKGTDVLKLIVKEFGEEILNNDGTLNRSMLGQKVFPNKVNLEKLNSITHPAITKSIKEKINLFTKEGHNLCVIDAALLIESSLIEMTDIVVVVYVNEKVQLTRLMERNKLSLTDALGRINSQNTFEFRKEYADYIIDNSMNIEYTRSQFNNILREIKIAEAFND
jgi:dephospho-CoA kinase